ncbi:hypothetical protein JAAARDRAFT_200350 [Jaapia argillacea MUCL 33604]|uniref:Uncharacterized protein n=1 Tax=Jaapia argillacea MUCL 33604 TaxID=933084 RepID=A0A067P541_9AGAM|nr:hypothetical protein JAAARDRAFT_200350 [Jaapia argillacea MUCL 33604]
MERVSDEEAIAEAESGKKQKAMQKKKKKAVKGETQAAIDVAKKKLEGKSIGKKPVAHKPENPAIGGLTDKDLDQDKPILPKTKVAVCENDFIYIGGTDSEVEVDAPTPTSKQKSRPKSVALPASKQPKVNHTPNRPKAAKKVAQVVTSLVKAEIVESLPPPQVQPTGGATDIATLPLFAQ